MTRTSTGYSSGSSEMNPFWLGEAKTGHFYEGTSRGTNARDRRSFRRRRRSGCYNSCGRGLTTEAPATRCRTPFIRKADARPPIGSRHQFTITNFTTAARQRRRRKLAGLQPALKNKLLAYGKYAASFTIKPRCVVLPVDETGVRLRGTRQMDRRRPPEHDFGYSSESCSPSEDSSQRRQFFQDALYEHRWLLRKT